MKLVIKDIECNGEELQDSLVALVIEIKCHKSEFSSETSSYVTYRHPNLQQDVIFRVLMSHNEVGLRAWGAGLFLAEVFLRSSHILRDKSILELGAGIGTTGLIVSSASIPFNRITLTDYSDDVLLNLHHNLALNAKRGTIRNSVQINPLDWEAVASGASSVPAAADVVFAADCTYCTSLCDHLIAALQIILSSSRSKATTPANEESGTQSSDPISTLFNVPCALLACTVRNEETFAYLLSLLSDPKRSEVFRWQDITSWAREVAGEQVFYYEDRCNIKVIYVTLNSNFDVYDFQF